MALVQADAVQPGHRRRVQPVAHHPRRRHVARGVNPEHGRPRPEHVRGVGAQSPNGNDGGPGPGNAPPREGSRAPDVVSNDFFLMKY